jgi:CRISPR/Cas system-associated exonuclease Cas4 (RecB family)
MQLGVHCPRGNIKHDECKRCSANPSRPCAWTPDMLELIRSDNDNQPAPDAFTPSRLLDCDRKSALISDHDYYQDLDTMWPAVRGHMVHALMERSTNPNALHQFREIRFETAIETKYGTQRFLGKPDLINVLTKNRNGGAVSWGLSIVDYKSKREVEHSLVSPERKHVMQLNMYAWLVTKCLSSYIEEHHPNIEIREEMPIEVEVTELELIYVDMSRVRRFTSEGPLKGKGKLIDRKTREKEVLDLEPIPLLPLEQTEEWIRKHIEQKIEAKQVLPPPLEGEAARICPYCPMFNVCSDLVRQGV